MERLLKYEWPGNIRELMHLLERLVVIVTDKVIEIDHLPVEMKEVTQGARVEFKNHKWRRTSATPANADGCFFFTKFKW